MILSQCKSSDLKMDCRDRLHVITQIVNFA